jgi:DeoR/GlpR family transcriptional regulator of sugar metabolism
MLLDERRKKILEIIENKGFVSLSELSDRADASESTVRRDLEYLDGIGQIRRTRGGAAYVGESLTEFEDRRGRALPQNRKSPRLRLLNLVRCCWTGEQRRWRWRGN